MNGNGYEGHVSISPYFWVIGKSYIVYKKGLKNFNIPLKNSLLVI
jgi:hypothetical protein